MHSDHLISSDTFVLECGEVTFEITHSIFTFLGGRYYWNTKNLTGDSVDRYKEEALEEPLFYNILYPQSCLNYKFLWIVLKI